MEPVITRVELSELLSISVETIDRMVKNEGLPFYRIGARGVRFRISEVERWLKERRRVND